MSLRTFDTSLCGALGWSPETMETIAHLDSLWQGYAGSLRVWRGHETLVYVFGFGPTLQLSVRAWKVWHLT